MIYMVVIKKGWTGHVGQSLQIDKLFNVPVPRTTAEHIQKWQTQIKKQKTKNKQWN